MPTEQTEDTDFLELETDDCSDLLQELAALWEDEYN